jgi:hypothetical protein
VLFRPKGIATGHTYRSITISPPYMDGNYMRVKVGPTTKYAWWLHFGRKPGKMPLKLVDGKLQPVPSLVDWVKEKHISGSYSTSGRRRGGKARREAEDLDVAWAIARSIGRHGTKPFPFLTVGFRQSKAAALRVFQRTLAQGVARGR